MDARGRVKQAKTKFEACLPLVELCELRIFMNLDGLLAALEKGVSLEEAEIPRETLHEIYTLMKAWMPKAIGNPEQFTGGMFGKQKLTDVRTTMERVLPTVLAQH